MLCDSRERRGNLDFGAQSTDAQRAGLDGHTRVCSTLILHCAVSSNHRDPGTLPPMQRPDCGWVDSVLREAFTTSKNVRQTALGRRHVILQAS
jgi:hypothetical protein